MKRNKPTLMDELMAEPMRLPGAPGLVVTRDWAYAWLKKMGYPLHGGLTTASTTWCLAGTWRRPNRTERLELTDLTEPWAIALIARMEQDCAA